MIKLASLIPIKEGGKLFGSRASRVSTSEMTAVFNHLFKLVGRDFKRMQLTRFLPTKETHGDVDIVVLASPGQSVKDILTAKLGKDILEYSKNSSIHSVLFHCEEIGKDVHVDFISNTNEESFDSVLQYFSYNDFSGIVGIYGKKLNFKYGSEGFFKRFRDKKGNWHDIFITHDLMKGLEVLGFSNVKSRFDSIQTIDDIVDFVASSPMFDSKFFTHGEMVQADRKSMNRPVISHCVNKLKDMHITAQIDDPDHFFRKLMPAQYAKVEEVKKEIDTKIYSLSKYNGEWIMSTFGLKPGPQLGKILKAISDKFGDALNDTDESEVIKFIRTLP